MPFPLDCLLCGGSASVTLNRKCEYLKQHTTARSGRARKSLLLVHLPKELAEEQECPDSSPNAFIFPDGKSGFMDTGNYRMRVLHKLARDLGLPNLTFQVIRRSIATLAQKKGTVKDVQGLLRHSRTATTGVYMQEIPEGVQATINAIHAEIRRKPERVQAD